MEGRQVLMFWYRNEIYAIEARSPAEGAYSEGFIRAKFTQVGRHWSAAWWPVWLPVCWLLCLLCWFSSAVVRGICHACTDAHVGVEGAHTPCCLCSAAGSCAGLRH